MVTLCVETRCRDVESLKKYLYTADNCFSPPLSKQVDIEDYAHKMAESAHLIWCVDRQKKVGLCAFYANRPPMAFLTSLSVLKEYQGKGLAKDMLEKMVFFCEQNGCQLIMLEVYKENCRARRLYKKSGFVLIEEDGEKYTMCRKVKNITEGEGT